MDDLNRRVAEALGWKIAKDESGSYMVEDADGKAVFLRSRNFIYHQYDAWNNSVEHWATNEKDAVSLLVDKTWYLYYYKKTSVYEIRVLRDGCLYTATDKSFSVAICEAFLKWHAATEGKTTR